MKPTILEETSTKLTLLLRAAGLKGRQVLEALRVATEEIIAVLKAEINKGNHQEVVTLLAAKAIIFGKNALFNKITGRVASRLMLRLGLPGLIAAGVVAVVVPFVLVKLRKKAMAKKDAGEFLETIEINGDEELQGKVQHLLEETNSPAATPPGPEERISEGRVLPEASK